MKSPKCKTKKVVISTVSSSSELHLALCSCLYAALESKLVSQFCEDENGALFFNKITNGLNGNNGYVYNNGQKDLYSNGNSVYGNRFQESLDRSAVTGHTRGRGHSIPLPINPGPLKAQVSSYKLTYCEFNLYCKHMQSDLKQGAV